MFHKLQIHHFNLENKPLVVVCSSDKRSKRCHHNVQVQHLHRGVGEWGPFILDVKIFPQIRSGLLSLASSADPFIGTILIIILQTGLSFKSSPVEIQYVCFYFRINSPFLNITAPVLSHSRPIGSLFLLHPLGFSSPLLCCKTSR